MENLKMYFNLIHRVGGSNLAMFELQQDLAHKHGLKCTMILGYDGLQNHEVVKRVKEYSAAFDEEIGMLLSITDTTTAISPPRARQKSFSKARG